MKFFALGGCALTVGLVGALLSGCVRTAVPVVAQPEARSAALNKSPIKHVVIVVQENRTFNNFFATFPGADGTTTGKAAKDPNCHIYKSETVPLRKTPLAGPNDLNHYYEAFRVARDGGKMDGFDEILYKNHMDACMDPYQYVDPAQIKPYWEIAKRYVLAEHMFTSQGSGGFTGHQDLIAAGTVVAPDEALVDLPTCSGPRCHWGCNAPARTRTSLISKDDLLQRGKGPFPCTKDFGLVYPTIRDRLDPKGISWRYYAPTACCSTNGRLFNAFDVIYRVRYGPEWKTNISSPQTNIFSDVSNGSLAGVSWVIPDGDDSDHGGGRYDNGPSWVASIVNAIGKSRYWRSTAVVVVWDDWGGLYDNFNPPRHGYGGFGFRVPALIVSPYAKAGHISTTNYEFGSILKYIEQNWSLRPLGTEDANANSIIDCFDYSQLPITFSPIASDHDKSYFIHREPSNYPLDDD
jgi:phospholipase C